MKAGMSRMANGEQRRGNFEVSMFKVPGRATRPTAPFPSLRRVAAGGFLGGSTPAQTDA
jgi:hypothetical protein